MMKDKIGAWEERRQAIEKCPLYVIENYYYNWHCGMCYSFNGTPYPTDYPRQTYNISSLTHKGGHMTFNCLDKYCKERGIKWVTMQC